ncbi:MAG: carbon monoxide dehydrogenase [Deltaproteobacteria bacterium]|nr:MAG: carbon monoxide dehydrogenase [Deltaproteobacteria bacterium]
MKIAISGKGGVGKTTLAGGLARYFAETGGRVLAIDADPDSNLPSSIGISIEEASKIKPLATLKDLIAERTGAKPGTFGGTFKLNPRVDDIPDEYGLEFKGIKLLTLGTVPKGGTGCLCPESTLLRVLLRHIMLKRGEAVIIDMEAGLEHLARGSTESMDAFIVVVEPGQRAIQTAHQIKRLAADLGVEKIFVVGNKVVDDGDRKLIEDGVAPMQLLGFMEQSEDIREADRKGVSAYDIGGEFKGQIELIAKKLREII